MIALSVILAIFTAALITVFVFQIKLYRVFDELADRLSGMVLKYSQLNDKLTDERREELDEAQQRAQRTFEEALNGIMQYTMNDAYRKPGGGGAD